MSLMGNGRMEKGEVLYSIIAQLLITRYIKQGRVPKNSRHYKIFCVNVKYGIQYGFRIFYLIALQNEENYEREESCSA
jgi:hypothetical protein